MEQILEKKKLPVETMDEENFMNYMYNNLEKKDKHQKGNAISYRAAESDTEKANDSVEEVFASSSTRQKNNRTASKHNRVKKNDTCNDEIDNLDKLSMINLGARYELLNANKMMVDLDIGLVYLLQ